MSNIEDLTRRAATLNGAIDSWNGAMIWALVLAALAAIAVVVTTRLALARAKQLGEVQAQLLRAKDNELASNLKEKDLRIAEATARANEAALELAKYKAPRSLTSEQAARVTAAMGQFAGMQFDGAIGPLNDPEPMVFFDQVAKSLAAAGWQQVHWKSALTMRLPRTNGTPDLGGVSVTNVIVDIHPTHRTRLQPVAQALAAALAAEGISAIADEGAGGGSENSAAIHILIGRKL